MNRPRAADDFPAIRVSIEELRRARAQVVGGADPRSVTEPKGRTESGEPTAPGGPPLPPALRRRLLR
jgi:hypothetical protein